MPETSIERFLGDQVRRLQLTSLMFEELHRTTGKGALALYGAVLNREARRLASTMIAIRAHTLANQKTSTPSTALMSTLAIESR